MWVHTVYHIARADLYERIRRFSFLITLGLTMLVAYFFVPPLEAGYVTLHMGDHYRGIYNSAWVGGSVALSITMFLSLFGFYLVKNSILRDHQTRVGYIIASTTVKKLHYLLGKAISNFIVLSIIVGVVMIMALIMQLTRGEVVAVELWPLVSPFLLVTLPMMSVIAALAVLFESRMALIGGLGNVIYFIIFILFNTIPSLTSLGTAVVTSDMTEEFSKLQQGFNGSYGIGFLVPEVPIERFEWQGVNWTGELVLRQLSIFLVALGIVVVATLLFRGFQESNEKSLGMKGKSSKDGMDSVEKKSNAEMESGWDGLSGFSQGSPSLVRASELTKVKIRIQFLPLVRAELGLMMKSASLGWYAIAGILSLLCLVMPAKLSSQWLIWPLLWIWPLLLWSGMGNREARYQSKYLVVSSPRYVIRQLSAVWVAGVILTLIIDLGMLIRFVIEGDYQHLILAIISAILIPSLALASGVLTGTSRTFEVLYMIIWYLGPLNKTAVLDFLGGADGGLNVGIMSLVYVLASLGLLILAYAFRSRLLLHS
ncbi:hypothetical protein SAMN04488542_11681 [Fontibacillus panacisegetis]|uniref:ABC-2 family transporter protein n=1 Tax=Fontibacillus panacisegetis TaxID=670482 RepID=A0A1G7NPF5_9BACL|nr:ABC transporter permease [Fontibacillus panacisegetis]SDF75934.1 hypothetical protein SAMN04488542_11681 [Fontibacillus panacisegetis]